MASDSRQESLAITRVSKCPLTSIEHNTGTVMTVDDNKEKMEPETDDEDEVFFGAVTEKEQSKMAKLRRRTEVFVANFRNAVRGPTESSDESCSTSSSSSWSHDLTGPASSMGLGGFHLQPSSLRGPASTNSSVLTPQAAASKIQTWFRLSRQAQAVDSALSEVQRLGSETDNVLTAIQKEKERIRLHGTPSQGSTKKGVKMTTHACTSAVVLVPSHAPCLVETSPQQDSKAQVKFDTLAVMTDCDAESAEIVFNATKDNTEVSRTTFPLPAKLETPTRGSNIPKANFQSTLDSLRQQPQKSNPTQASPCVLGGNSCFQNTDSQISSATKGCIISNQSQNIYNTPVKQSIFSQATVNLLGTSLVYSSRTPLGLSVSQAQIKTKPNLFSLSKVSYEQIQSSTVFSSPKLFPTTVQAVQSQQSCSSALLFSPHKVPNQKVSEVEACSEKLTSKSFDFDKNPATSQKACGDGQQSNCPLDSKLVFDFDPEKFKPDSSHMDTDSLRDESFFGDFGGKCTTLWSVPSTSPPSVKLTQVAIVTPQSVQDVPYEPKRASDGTVDSKMTLWTDESHQHRLSTPQQKAPAQDFLPSLVADIQETPSTILSSTTQEETQNSSLHSASSTSSESAGCMTSILADPTFSNSARCKLELLEQKKAELARIREQKAELKQALVAENEMCFQMKQGIQMALRSNTSQTDIPVHLLSLGCRGVSSLTLTDQELDIVTRLHTIRNSRHEEMHRATHSPMVSRTRNKESLHLRWHSRLVTEVQHMSSPSCPRRVPRPILTKPTFKARRVPVTRTASPAARRVNTGLPQTPRQKLAF